MQHVQVKEEATALAVHCASGLRVTGLGNEATDAARRAAIATAGHVVVATPGRLAIALQDGTLPAPHLAQHLKVRRSALYLKLGVVGVASESSAPCETCRIHCERSANGRRHCDPCRAAGGCRCSCSTRRTYCCRTATTRR